jgi:uncharacterized membrane protein
MNKFRVQPRKFAAFWGSWIVVAFSFMVGAFVLPMSSDRIPIHWDIAGKADGYAAASIGLFLMPLVSLAIQLLLMVLPRLDPGRENYVSFNATYWKLAFVFQMNLAGIQMVVCASAMGRAVQMNVAIAAMLGVMLIVLGNFLGKLRPNWMIGIRTPWTLSSKQSWNQTHRLGRWMFMAMGVAVGLLAIVPTMPAFVIVAVFCVACLFALTVYSWWIWRSDPDKIAAASVQPALTDSADILHP